MKLKFDANLDYQHDAINAVRDVFKGQAMAISGFAINIQKNNLVHLETGFGNKVTLPDEVFLENLHAIQEKNNIQKSSQLGKRDFSIEMETGTGKTYVYLRSIFELSFHYNFRKFIIVVPSIAVREGVLKSIEMMHTHFKTLYKNKEFSYFVYDSKKLSTVRQFATSNHIEIMIINIQSFQRDIDDMASEEELKKANVMNREQDKMEGRKPIEFIQEVKPIVIIDEPQSVDNTDKAKQAIKNLNPCAIFRYSATHKEIHNLIYCLNPIQAYDMGLVKKIEVASVLTEDSFNMPYIKLLKTDNKDGIKAQIEIHQEKNGAVKPIKIWVKHGEDIWLKSGKRQLYKNYIISEINCTPEAEFIEFGNGTEIELGQAIGNADDDIMKAQIYNTIEQHFEKQIKLKGKKIKTLSLFFIDKVSNYRIYNEDGKVSLGKFGQWFEEAYHQLTQKHRYKKFATDDVAKLHNGYFAKDKKGKAKDTTGKSQDDNDAYNLIMRDKERLLNIDEPLQFIFSHSALREGWDNPNVFQICTLNQTQSTDKKRQEIGRGLRLPVNNKGERVHDKDINRLTIIANESYEQFVNLLQKEFAEDCGIKFGKVEKIAFAKIECGEDNDKTLGQEASTDIWQQLLKHDYINAQGTIQDKFAPDNPHFQLKIDKKYQEFAPAIIDRIQKYVLKNRVGNVKDKKQITFKKQVYLSEDFKELWDKIKHHTRYRVEFDTNELIEEAAKQIKEEADSIVSARIITRRASVAMSDAGLETQEVNAKNQEIAKPRYLPDLLIYLQQETELTRDTLVKILKKSNQLNKFLLNPQVFIFMSAKQILKILNNLMLDGIEYQKIDGKYWAMHIIEEDAEKEMTRYIHNLYHVQNVEKTLYNNIECDSEIEKQFAKDLDKHEAVKFFMKLPTWFKIDTPVGSYNPDWAFVAHEDKKLYFVRETKGSRDKEDLRIKENQKIKCGKKHFEELGVDYAVVTNFSEVSI